MRGGARKGAGAPPKDPVAGARKMWSGRLPSTTLAALKRLVRSKAFDSEADVIVKAVEQLEQSSKR